jgi:hypothetical protein
MAQAKENGSQFPGFQPKEAEKLGAFQGTIRAVNKAEKMVENGQSVPVIRISAGGEKSHSNLDAKEVFKMKSAAFELYADHLYPHDNLREAANDIVATEKSKTAKAEAEKQEEISNLRTLWEMTPDADPDDEERVVR